MKLINKFKNYRLKFREKLTNPCHQQLFRLIKMFFRSPLKSFRMGVLKVMVNLTYDCDCDCDYCWCGSHKRYPGRELSLFEVKKILDEISEFPSLIGLVSFVGGEPFLREDIYEVVKYATKKGLFSEIETNGIELSKSAILRLKKSGLNHIFVKIEGSNAEKHDLLAKIKGCFDKAINGIKISVEQGLSCSIFMNASKKKIEENELAKIINIAKKLNVNSVRIIYPMLSGRWINREDQRLNRREKREIEKLFEPGFVYLESSYGVYEHKDRICAALDKKFFHISCYGEVQPCPFVPVSFGNLRSRSLKEILKHMWTHPIFSTRYTGCLMDNLTFRKKYILPAGLDISYKNVEL